MSVGTYWCRCLRRGSRWRGTTRTARIRRTSSRGCSWGTGSMDSLRSWDTRTRRCRCRTHCRTQSRLQPPPPLPSPRRSKGIRSTGTRRTSKPLRPESKPTGGSYLSVSLTWSLCGLLVVDNPRMWTECRDPAANCFYRVCHPVLVINKA